MCESSPGRVESKGYRVACCLLDEGSLSAWESELHTQLINAERRLNPGSLNIPRRYAEIERKDGEALYRKYRMDQELRLCMLLKLSILYEKL